MEATGMQRAHRALLVLLPLVSGLGSVVTVAGLALIRPFAVLLVIVALLRLRTSPTRHAMLVAALALVWVGFGFFWPLSSSGISELASIGLGLATVWALIATPADDDDLRSFAAGWGIAWVAAIVPAIGEILTGRHLPNYLLSSPPYVRQASTDIASFFVNPNLFAYFISIASLVLVVASSWMKSRRWQLLLVVPVLVNPIFVWFSGSRITLLVSVGLLLWTGWVWLPRFRRHVLAAMSVGVAAAGLAVLYSPKVQALLEQQSTGSTQGRLGLYRNGLWMVPESGGLGVGPGRFEDIIAYGQAPYPTGGAINPHSGVFEILDQYGVVIAAIAFGVLIAVGLSGLRGFVDDHLSRGQQVIEQSLTVSALMMLLSSFSNSSFLDSPIAWLHVAALGLFATSVRRRRVVVPQPKVARYAAARS